MFCRCSALQSKAASEAALLMHSAKLVDLQADVKIAQPWDKVTMRYGLLICSLASRLPCSGD